MANQLNPEKSKKLRPLRIVLAILVAILIVLILDRLPTSVKGRPEATSTASEQTTARETPPGATYYYFSGFLNILEQQLEARLAALGVPEEEYENVAEYLTKDEIYTLEAKTALAASLDETYVETDADGVKELRQIFGLGEDYSFEKFHELTTAPAEYKILSELLADYHKTLDTVEDYDAPAE